MNDLIALAEKPEIPQLFELDDNAVDFMFGGGESKYAFGTESKYSTITNHSNTRNKFKPIGFISRARKGNRHYTVLHYSDLTLSFSRDASDVIVRDGQNTIGSLPRFTVAKWSFESANLNLSYEHIFWSLFIAQLSFGTGMKFKVRYGDGCLLYEDLNSYLLQRGGQTRKITLGLILYARFFRSG